MFLRNAWYAAAFSEELGTNLLPITLLGERVVLYRTTAGAPVALEDSCAHRRLPLSMGRIEGDTLRCAYHGIVYAATGRCLQIPGEKSVPPGAGVRAFSAVERDGFVWLWAGATEAVDAALIPDFRGAGDPALETANLHLRIKAFYQLHLDNLLDLSHIGFVHATTTGTAQVVESGEVETLCEGEVVRVLRRQRGVAPPAIFGEFGRFAGPVDMWQITEFRPPCYVRLNYGTVPAGDGVPADLAGYWTNGEWGFRVFQCITPETERTTHQFRCIKFARRGASEETVARLGRQLDQVSLEDAPILAAQQAALDADGRRTPLDLGSTVVTASDAGSTHMRRIVAARLAAEGGRGRTRRAG
jgi:vanillate O-demethylase monooxygenase subunit